MSQLILFIELQSWLYSILVLGYGITILSCIIIILSENRNPIKSLAWVTVLIFMPVIGLVFYIFFGRNIKGKHRLIRHNKRKVIHILPSRALSLRDLSMSRQNCQIVKLANTIGETSLTIGNEIDVFTGGEDKFAALKEDLRRARNFICMQYYIFSDDMIGREIADILMERARAGVKVKVIYDHVGSFNIRRRFFKELRAAGVDAQPFLRVSFPQLANRINWRNHRKIVVIDGHTAYIGGMNIADRYLKPCGRKAAWRDTHFRLRGAIIGSLLHSFALDWSYMGRPFPKSERTYRPVAIDNAVAVQLLTSGPDGQWPNLAMVFLKAISSAQKSIYIQTPYFLPTDALLKALQAAALSQIDVRIMIPRHGDSLLLTLASYSYITQCLKAGIKIYLYENTMLHSKLMIIDDDFVTSGSTNFDFRSFEHNFEANIFIYDKGFNRRMRDIYFEDLRKCTKMTLARWRSRPPVQRALESILRLLSPIL